jgi:hypothetical protein
MQDREEWNMIAPCGLYCGECTAFLRKECGGCRSNEGLSREYREHCKIFHCSNTKNLRICLECRDFPCKLFDFFKAERLEESSWFLDVWSNMRQIKESGLTHFLKKKEEWLKRRKECAENRGVEHCDECGYWPCELLKRPVLGPIDLKKFREFMEKTCESKGNR